jgi:hypothetical protein
MVTEAIRLNIELLLRYGHPPLSARWRGPQGSESSLGAWQLGFLG